MRESVDYTYCIEIAYADSFPNADAAWVVEDRYDVERVAACGTGVAAAAYSFACTAAGMDFACAGMDFACAGMDFACEDFASAYAAASVAVDASAATYAASYDIASHRYLRLRSLRDPSDLHIHPFAGMQQIPIVDRALHSVARRASNVPFVYQLRASYSPYFLTSWTIVAAI